MAPTVTRPDWAARRIAARRLPTPKLAVDPREVGGYRALPHAEPGRDLARGQPLGGHD